MLIICYQRIFLDYPENADSTYLQNAGTYLPNQKLESSCYHFLIFNTYDNGLGSNMILLNTEFVCLH
jgi:hypothetical protein